VQNETSKALLLTVGIKDNVAIGGDTRFDRVIAIASQFEPIPLIENFCGNSKVIVAGSTWEDDEAELIHYVRNHPEIKFIIAPHEIDTANLIDVKKEFAGAVFYSELVGGEEMTDDRLPTTEMDTETTTSKLPNESHVLIIDNIGMLSKLYHYAHITYVGGGFGEDGIHNVLEPAVYGKPVIYGPVYAKFAEAVELVDCGAGISIYNALELENVFDKLWADTTLLHEKSEAAKKYVYSKVGATQKVMAYIQEKRLLTN
jgi:3-deoxy-D-manno-octulosonic-acid transferase